MRRSRQIVPEALVTLMSLYPRDFSICLVMVAGRVEREGCGQGKSCELKLSVELFEGEFVGVLQFLFDSVHDTFNSVRGCPFCMRWYRLCPINFVGVVIYIK